jgi:ribonuclease HII
VFDGSFTTNAGGYGFLRSQERHRAGYLNTGHRFEFPVAPQASLAHDPGMIREKSGNDITKLPKGVIAVAPPSFRRERALIRRGVWPVAGCDEAGRGPLAGPVVAAAVVLDPKRIPRGIDDSKRLTPQRREELFEEICATASFAVAFASPARIDRDNILRASLWALARAVHALPELPKHVFVDGRDRLDTPCGCDAVIGGDGLVLSIAAASIIAKVSRDRLMCALAQDCPGYGFESHKGYGVPEHLEALNRLGPTVHHRRFFAPVAAAREKHQALTIESGVIRMEIRETPEVSVAAV